MKILIVNHYAGSRRHGMEFRPYDLAIAMKQAGCEVEIVTASYTHLRSENFDLNNKWMNELEVNKIKYYILKTIKYRNNGALRLVNIIVFLLNLWCHRRFFKRKGYDCIIFSSTYPFDVYLMSALKSSNKNKQLIIWELHDLWPLSLQVLHGLRPKSLFARVCYHAQQYAVEKSDLVISLLENAEIYYKKLGLKPRKFIFLPLGFVEQNLIEDSIDCYNSEIEEKLLKLKRINKCIIVYSGYFGEQNAIDRLMDAADKLHQEQLHFVLIGDGPLKPLLRQKLRKNVSIFDRISNDKLHKILKICDISYLGGPDSELYNYGVSPNKLLDYMCAKLPVIWSYPVSSSIIETAKCGVSVTASADGVISGIKTLVDMEPLSRKHMGALGRDYLLDKMSYEQIAETLIINIEDNNA